MEAHKSALQMAKDSSYAGQFHEAEGADRLQSAGGPTSDERYGIWSTYINMQCNAVRRSMYLVATRRKESASSISSMTVTTWMIENPCLFHVVQFVSNEGLPS